MCSQGPRPIKRQPLGDLIVVTDDDGLWADQRAVMPDHELLSARAMTSNALSRPELAGPTRRDAPEEQSSCTIWNMSLRERGMHDSLVLVEHRRRG